MSLFLKNHKIQAFICFLSARQTLDFDKFLCCIFLWAWQHKESTRKSKHNASRMLDNHERPLAWLWWNILFMIRFLRATGYHNFSEPSDKLETPTISQNLAKYIILCFRLSGFCCSPSLAKKHNRIMSSYCFSLFLYSMLPLALCCMENFHWRMEAFEGGILLCL